MHWLDLKYSDVKGDVVEIDRYLIDCSVCHEVLFAYFVQSLGEFGVIYTSPEHGGFSPNLIYLVSFCVDSTVYCFHELKLQ